MLHQETIKVLLEVNRNFLEKAKREVKYFEDAIQFLEQEQREINAKSAERSY